VDVVGHAPSGFAEIGLIGQQPTRLDELTQAYIAGRRFFSTSPTIN
jgi:hypothetical protein